jgi:peptidoglycan glycosyltransferase
MNRYVAQFQVVESLKFGGISTARGNYDISQAGAVSFAWSCIGQHTDLVNPARFMAFMGAIAADGAAAEPYLVSSISREGKTTYKAKTQKMDRIMSEEVASQLHAYLRNNVKSKYGDWNFPGLAVCAKSGTSQLGGNKVSNAMFAGFVENEEYPLAFMVVVENGGYGASACVPVISQVLAACKTEIDSE